MLSHFFQESFQISNQSTTVQTHSVSLSTSLPTPGRPRASACFRVKARLMRVPGAENEAHKLLYRFKVSVGSKLTY